MAKVWVFARSTGGKNGDVLVFVRRWYLPRWKIFSKLHGRMSSMVNAEKENLNKKCEEVFQILERIQRAEAQLQVEREAVDTRNYDHKGETKWWEEDIKFLKTIGKDVNPPDEYYRKILHPQVINKMLKPPPKSNTDGRWADGAPEIPSNLDLGESRSIFVGPGTPEHIRKKFASDVQADYDMEFKPPQPKKDSNNKGKQVWKNRRKGESDEDYKHRMSVGEENWTEDE